jgi:alpha,alpha-trehalase
MRLLLAGLLFVAQLAGAQTPKTPIGEYIHDSWDTLTRSQASCTTLADPKVTTEPVLYLPFGMSVPKEIANLEKTCHLQVEHLPRRIKKLGEIDPATLPKPGLLYLPNPYVVPGGRFNEMYGWDSYFILLGLTRDKPAREELAYGMLANFFFEIDNYGAVLNANRTYYLTRSQPPLLSSMIREVYEHDAHPDPRWLAYAYGYAVRDHELWNSAPHLAGKTGLARYFDVGHGPVPEMEDDNTYYADVIHWFLAHPDQAEGYVIEAPGNPSAEEAEALAKTSCDLRASKVCANAHVLSGGVDHRLTAEFFAGDRAMRESGFDTTFRFGPFSADTENYAPVCLNSLLYKYELDLAHIATLIGKNAEAAQWASAAALRKAAMDKYLWNPTVGLYMDYDFVEQTRSTYHYLTSAYPLWAGAASDTQAAIVARHLTEFEHSGGLAMSTTDSGTQWDLPYGWAPTTWLAVGGLEAYGFHAQASRVAREFSTAVEQNFDRDRTIREKYNVVDGSANIAVAAGYKANVVGFGWTNAVYLMLQELLTSKAAAAQDNP